MVATYINYINTLKFIFKVRCRHGTYIHFVHMYVHSYVHTYVHNYMHCYVRTYTDYNVLLFLYAVPAPIVNISVPNNLTTGQPVTMNCTIVVVRGISSRVDIVWYSGLRQVRRVNNATASMLNGTAAVYRDSFSIHSLSTQYDGRAYSCDAIINSDPLVVASSSVTLNITSKLTVCMFLLLCMYVAM